MHNINERLAHLERAAHRTRRRLLVGLPATFFAGIGLAVLMGASVTATDHLRTKRVDIVNAEGRTVLALGADSMGGRLDLWTPQGGNILRLAGNDHGGDVAVWSNNGTTNAGLWATNEGGELALWHADGTALANVETNGLTIRGDVHVQNAQGDNSLRLSGEFGSLTARHDGHVSALTAKGVLVSTNVLLNENGLTVADAGQSIFDNDHTSYSNSAITSMHAQMDFSNEGIALGTNDTALLLGDGSFHIEHADTQVLHASTMDGHTSLLLAGDTSGIRFDVAPDEAVVSATVAGEGTAALRVDAGGARTTLTGDGDIVTLASHRDEPLLGAGSGGLTMFASGGSGAIELGTGEAGSVRLVAGSDGSVPAVEILDRAGLRAAAMSMEAAGAGAFVAGHGGTPTAVMRGRSLGGRLDLRGENGTVLIRSGSGPMTALLGPDGRTMAMLAGTGTGGVLNLMDTQGMPVVLTGASAEGQGGAAAYRNADGATVVTAGAGHTAGGRVQVVDPTDNKSSTLAPPRAGTVNAGAR